MIRNYLIVACIVYCVAVAPAHGYFVTVDAHSEECFFDRVEAGMTMGNVSLKLKSNARFCLGHVILLTHTFLPAGRFNLRNS